MKPLYGIIFKEYLSKEKYSHWGWGDLDIIYGKMDKFVTQQVLDNFDIITMATQNGVVFARGQLTILKNTKRINELARKNEKFYYEHVKEGKHNYLDEHFFTSIIVENQDISLYHLNIQSDGGIIPMEQIFVRWEKGRILIFLPSFNGANKIDFSDSLNNSISEQNFHKNCHKFLPEFARFCVSDGYYDRFRKKGEKQFFVKRAPIYIEFGFFHVGGPKYFSNQISSFDLNTVDNFEIFIDSKKKILKIYPA